MEEKKTQVNHQKRERKKSQFAGHFLSRNFTIKRKLGFKKLNKQELEFIISLYTSVSYC